jgi:hypothetical protein
MYISSAVDHFNPCSQLERQHKGPYNDFCLSLFLQTISFIYTSPIRCCLLNSHARSVRMYCDSEKIDLEFMKNLYILSLSD